MLSLKKNVLSLAGRLILKLTGWKMVEISPPPSGCVIIGAPHTSNWDFLFGIAFLFASGIDFCWMGKQSLFRPPWASLFRWMGGIPVDRSGSGNQVAGAVEVFRKAPRTSMVLAPEGTRKKVVHWHTGFYWIARGAGVPVILGFLDYRKKALGFGARLSLTGDFEKDMAKIRAFYGQYGAGKKPGQESLAEAVPGESERKAPGGQK